VSQHITSIMETDDREDITAEIRLQVSDAAREDSQLTQTHISQDRVSSSSQLSIVSTNCVVSADVSTPRSDEHKERQHVKTPDIVPEELILLPDSACMQQTHCTDNSDHCSDVLGSIKCEEKPPERNAQEMILHLDNTEQADTWSEEVGKPHIQVKSEKVEPEDCSSNSPETRHWVVCHNGVLKEVKVEPTDSKPDIRETSICNENFDQQQLHGKDNDEKYKSHTNVKPYTCDQCGKTFTTKCSLKTHERIHTGVRPYSCRTCGKSFRQLGHFTTHERIHSNSRPFTCETCGKSFKGSAALKGHERIHTGEKPYTCRACGKSYSFPASLRYHQRSHTGIKPHTCVTCGKSFVYLGHLTAHETTHTRERPFTCGMCGESFYTSKRRKSHEKTHINRITCATCGMSFFESWDLSLHEAMGACLRHTR
ncbi:hypothetical protein LSAT2_004144, partial [Lamellibrachia satsuma]